MRVLITGSNGFIGSNCCRWIKATRTWEIIGLGRSSQSNHPYTDSYVPCELGSRGADTVLDSALAGVGAVIHLAADMRREPHNVEVVAANCIGTQQLLEACEHNGIKAFMQLSSLPLIGRPTVTPITEDTPPHPPTIYHATKFAEELFANYADYAHGLRTASFRICAPVGNGMNPKTIFPTFIHNALANEPLTLLGKGTRRQTYIHVDDIALALCLAIEHDCHGVYNLASRNLVSNRDLAERVVHLLGSRSPITFDDCPDPQDNVSWDVSIERLRNDAGFEPQIDLDRCILSYADFLRSE